MSTTLVDLVTRVAGDMRNSAAAYIFAGDLQPGGSQMDPHSPLPLQILRLSNKGKPRSLDQLVTLRRQPLSSTSTLENIASNRNSFAHPDECIEDGRFVLNFGQ